jgi:hypothetical protein
MTCCPPSRRSLRACAIRAGSADEPETRIPASTEMAAQMLESHVHLMDRVRYPWWGDLTIAQQPLDVCR